MRHPGQVRLRRARAGIQKKLDSGSRPAKRSSSGMTVSANSDTVSWREGAELRKNITGLNRDEQLAYIFKIRAFAETAQRPYRWAGRLRVHKNQPEEPAPFCWPTLPQGCSGCPPGLDHLFVWYSSTAHHALPG